MDVGAFTVTVDVSDGLIITNYPLSVTVTNTAPIFGTNPTSQVIYAGTTTNYGLPPVSDAEGQSVSISLSPPLAWYSATTGTLSMSPTSAESGTTFSVDLILSDSFDSSSYTISITVKSNLQPSFA